MVVNDKIIFLHLQKCGGTFLKKVLIENFNCKNVLPEHNGYKDIRNKNNKFIFGTVRNPWDWYVSLYHSHYQNPHSFFKSTFKGVNSFSEWIDVFLNLKSGKMHDLNFNEINRLNVGPYGYRYLKVYSLNNNLSFDNTCKIDIIDTKELNSNFVSLLEKNDLLSDKELMSKILNHSKIHTSKRGDYREFYDEKSIQIVYEKEKKIINKYNYEFE